MKQIDPAAAQRVWQRVHSNSSREAAGQSTPLVRLEREVLLRLREQLLSDAEAFRQRSRSATPAQQVLLRQLEQQYMAEASCIKGMLVLGTGNVRGISERNSPTDSLRHCYDNALRRLSDYTLRIGDPRFGAPFRQLEQQTRQHCVMLLELLGMGLS